MSSNQSTGRTNAGGNGRNAGRGNSNNNTGRRGNGSGNKSGKKEQKDKKFHPLSRGKTPEYSFEDVKKSLIIKMSAMKMDYIDDMIVSVRDMQLLDLKTKEPTLAYRSGTDEAILRANEEARARYAADRKDWKARSVAFDNNKRYLYGKIMGMCTEYMMDKLEREADYDSTLFNDPIELLKRIKKFMTITGDTEWEYFALWEAMKKLFSCQQKENENVATYRKRFEETATTVASLTGNKMFEKFAEKTQEYGLLSTDNERKKYKKESWERLMANGLMFNSDRAKYQSRIDTMNAQYTLKHLDYKQRCT